jgi:hypothetical protein
MYFKQLMTYGLGIVFGVLAITGLVIEYRRREKNHKEKIRRLLNGADDFTELPVENMNSGDVSNILIAAIILICGLSGIGLIFYIAHVNIITLCIAAFILLVLMLTMMILRDNTRRMQQKSSDVLHPVSSSVSRLPLVFKTVVIIVSEIAFIWFTIYTTLSVITVLISLVLVAMTALVLVNEFKKFKAQKQYRSL